jgi:D-alanyl-D-alanine carboxypeptidase
MNQNKLVSPTSIAALLRVPLLLASVGLVLFTWSVSPSWAEVRSNKRPAAVKKAVKKPENKVEVKKRAKTKAATTNARSGHSRKKPATKTIKRVPKGVLAKAYYCVNLADNRAVLERNPDKQLPVASLTKLITALVAIDSMPFDRKLTVPDHIKKVPKSVIGLKPGDELSVEDVLHGLLMASGNDCAETLACSYPGGRDDFIKAMNRKVKSMGTAHTVFYTPSGLDRKVVQNREGKQTVDVDSNVSTAREIALVTRAAFSHPEIRRICRKTGHTLKSAKVEDGYAVRNTNKLLRDNLPLIAGKTGYTSRAGHCLASEFACGRDVYVIVVLGSPDHFRDTRLVYHKALQEDARTKTADSNRVFSRRIASTIITD